MKIVGEISERGMLAEPCPYHARVAGRSESDGFELYAERFAAGEQGTHDGWNVTCSFICHITDEIYSKMKIVQAHPFDAFDMLIGFLELFAISRVFDRHGNGEEQSHENMKL